MVDERVRSDVGVCLVGGGHVDPEVIAKALKFAPCIVAADGGADAALAVGASPVAVIGDFDSVSDDARGRLTTAKLIQVDEQDSTDFEKCLNRIDAPFIIAVGFTGGRLDHTLAVLSALAREVGPPTLLLDAVDCAFATGQKLRLDLASGTRVSLFPMAAVTGRSRGLRWAIDGLHLSPAGRIGTSNEATGPIDAEFDSTGMIVIVPEGCLPNVLTHLRG